jgi:endonuclease/exonuclease/phosphatase family metal-dependent hydrolase
MEVLAMSSLRFMILLTVLALIPCQAASQGERIVIDGEFLDWDHLTPACTDPIGDEMTGDIDFGRLWASYDGQYVFLSLEVGAEINLQSLNQITLYIDTDGSSHTGTRIDGIGADLEWTFGQRSGYLKRGLLPRRISHDDIGLVSAPTVTSTRFEVAIARRAGLAGYRSRFPSPTWHIVIVDEHGGDRIPDSGEVVTVRFDKAPAKPLTPISLGRHDRDHLRILSYNVLWDGIFDPDPARREAFAGILRAVDPDIIGFQEVFSHGARQTRAFIQSTVFSGFARGFGRWYSSKPDPNSDIVLVSRYPIRQAYPIGGNAAFLLDLSPWYECDLLLIVAHPPCCGNNTGRQWEIDAIMAFIRDAKETGGVLDIQPDTPIVVMGDMNFVGDSQQLKTLITGDIVNTVEHGPAFAPDWDGTDFADLLPRHTHLPMAFTWFSPDEYFWPGRLDYVVYSDAVIDIGNNFVLFTPGMPADVLTSSRLKADYTTKASDHLPVVCDLVLPVSKKPR